MLDSDAGVTSAFNRKLARAVCANKARRYSIFVINFPAHFNHVDNEAISMRSSR